MKDLMHYKNYYGSVHFDQDDLIFYGKVQFIRALVSYEGTTAKGLKKAFQQAIDDYLYTCKEQGLDPEIPFKGSLNIRVGQDLHRQIAIAAAKDDISINKFITQTLKEVVDQRGV
jgi:predicted HicB family RNase H-like nuclease